MAINPHRKGGPDVPVTDGGTGASSAGAALSALGGLDETAHDLLDHTGLMGVGGGGLTLIERKEFLVNAASYSFTGLDGDVDETYVLKGNFFHSTGGGNDNVYLRPNGIALGGNFSGNQTNFSAATVQGSALAGFWLANVPAGNPDWPTMTEARFDAARTLAGLARRRQYGARLDGWNQIFLVIGVWNETATNVTSLLVAADSGSIGAGSVLTLYKTIP